VEAFDMMSEAERAEYRRQARAQFFKERGEVDPFPDMFGGGVAAARGEPASHDTFGIEERCRREWEQSAALRAEFTCLEAYIAFRRAEAKGLVRIISRPRNA
jgi:hypothetical protein